MARQRMMHARAILEARHEVMSALNVTRIRQLIYDDGIVAVALASTTDGGSSLRLAIRWLEPQSYRDRDQRVVETTNAVGGATDWFIVPLTFGAAIGRTLVEQHAAGLTGFAEDGFAALVRWLVDDGELHDSMCY